MMLLDLFNPCLISEITFFVRSPCQSSETDGDNLRCTPTCFSLLLIERLGSSTADHLLNFKADAGTMRRAAYVVGVLRRAENGCLTLRHDKDRQCALKVERGLR